MLDLRAGIYLGDYLPQLYIFNCCLMMKKVVNLSNKTLIMNRNQFASYQIWFVTLTSLLGCPKKTITVPLKLGLKDNTHPDLPFPSALLYLCPKQS